MINNGRMSFLTRAGTAKACWKAACPSWSMAMTVGAVGVSGVKSAEDAQIAKAGIAALGI